MTRAVGGGAVRVGNDIRMDALALVQLLSLARRRLLHADSSLEYGHKVFLQQTFRVRHWVDITKLDVPGHQAPENRIPRENAQAR